MSKMMRISDITVKHLNELTKQTGKTRQDILEHAIELFAREMFLKKTNEEYEQLTKSEKKKYQSEAGEWDSSLEDGLDYE